MAVARDLRLRPMMSEVAAPPKRISSGREHQLRMFQVHRYLTDPLVKRRGLLPCAGISDSRGTENKQKKGDSFYHLQLRSCDKDLHPQGWCQTQSPRGIEETCDLSETGSTTSLARCKTPFRPFSDKHQTTAVLRSLTHVLQSRVRALQQMAYRLQIQGIDDHKGV